MTLRPVRKADHPMRTARYAATPQPVRQVGRSVYTVRHPVRAAEHAAAGAAPAPPSLADPRHLEHLHRRPQASCDAARLRSRRRRRRGVLSRQLRWHQSCPSARLNQASVPRTPATPVAGRKMRAAKPATAAGEPCPAELAGLVAPSGPAAHQYRTSGLIRAYGSGVPAARRTGRQRQDDPDPDPAQPPPRSGAW